jgi:hypothetical protein
MTQTIVQGPEDPLLVLDHQGGSGNPSFLIQQDETAVAGREYFCGRSC